MPFFSNSSYLSTPQRFWIWLLLTIPSTAIAFSIYWAVTQRQKRRKPIHPEEANKAVEREGSNEANHEQNGSRRETQSSLQNSIHHLFHWQEK